MRPGRPHQRTIEQPLFVQEVGADVADGLVALSRCLRVTGLQVGQGIEPPLCLIDEVQRLVRLPHKEVEAALLHRSLDTRNRRLEFGDRLGQREEGGTRLVVGLSLHHVAETDQLQRPTQNRLQLRRRRPDSREHPC